LDENPTFPRVAAAVGGGFDPIFERYIGLRRYALAQEVGRDPRRADQHAQSTYPAGALPQVPQINAIRHQADISDEI
jgi:hypothetical protein